MGVQTEFAQFSGLGGGLPSKVVRNHHAQVGLEDLHTTVGKGRCSCVLLQPQEDLLWPMERFGNLILCLSFHHAIPLASAYSILHTIQRLRQLEPAAHRFSVPHPSSKSLSRFRTLSRLRPAATRTSQRSTAAHGVRTDPGRSAPRKLEAQQKGRRTVRAQQLWFRIIEAQMETGTPYMLYKDPGGTGVGGG